MTNCVIMKLQLYVNNFLCLEVFFVKEIGQWGDEFCCTDGRCLVLEFATFECYEPVGKCILGFLRDVRATYLDKVGQWHHGTRDDEVETGGLKHRIWRNRLGMLLFLGIRDVANLFSASVLSGDICKTEGLHDLVAYANLLTNRIDKMEMNVGEHNRQRNAREATACAEVHDPCVWTEIDNLCYAKRMEDVVLIEVVNILAGDDVNLGIPIVIERIEGYESFTLLGCEVWEVFINDGHNVRVE